jgi:hypothetical protein
LEWPRAKVAEIKLNSSNAKLIVRVAGVAFVELYLGPNRALNAYVADVLAAALREPMSANVIDAAGERQGAVETRTHFDGVSSRRLRHALLAVAAVMAAAGLVIMFLPITGAPAGVYLIVFASAPAGIALGTQDKDFYV